MLKKEVLRKKRDFDRVYRKGRSLGEKYVVLFYLKNGLPLTRTAVVASKKVGNSVQRNRAKRLMSESLRQVREDILPGYDIVVIARNTIDGRSCDEVGISLRRGLSRASLLRKEAVK